MNDLITNRILMLRAIPQAFIGITDKDSEGTWTYEDGWWLEKKKLILKLNKRIYSSIFK